MIEQIREFAPGDRYHYDFVVLTYEKGWAQVDTKQDASYYGTWTNPNKLQIFSYCEGDICLTKCTTEDEYRAEVQRCADWNIENGYWKGIDPGFSESMKARFIELNLGHLLH